ncbi:MAG: lipase [Oscillospiraceae bacterium]|jgi:triacylglycerol lipase|nr:lipase [Oscillospiraceae bacterium]
MQGFILKFISFLVSVLSLFGIIKGPYSTVELSETQLYPYVLVHGLMGWGDDAPFDDVFEYWGGDRNIPQHLTNLGCETHVAMVGAISSAWDRACELYAQLTGATVDYGAAHAEKYGHARFGRTYETPMIEDWSAENKINLVGHSFGGATVRLLVSLLADGSEEEIATTDEGEISPLFTGGKSNYVYSVTTLAAPHNGSTYGYALDLSESSVFLNTLISAYSVYGNSDLRHAYDPMLDQWGITVPPDGQSWSSFNRESIANFVKSKDSSAHDLTPGGAAELNEKITFAEGVYYYSYYGCCTKENPLTGNQICYTLNMFTASAGIVGRTTGDFDGIVIDKSWLPNDGLVSVVSAKYPFGQPNKAFDEGNQETGVWQVMPEKTGWNHCTFMFANDPVLGSSELVDFYISLVNTVSATYE